MKKVITEQFIIEIIKSGTNTVEIDEDTLITPLAQDRINSAGVKIVIIKMGLFDIFRHFPYTSH